MKQTREDPTTESRWPGLSTWTAVLLGLAFFFQAYFAAQRKSLTWDEPTFIAAGYSNLTRNDFRLNPSHPPLLQELAALPLVFSDLNAPKQDVDYWLEKSNPVVAYGRELIYQSGNDVALLASRARLPIMLLGSALIVMMFFWGRALYGPGPALVGTALAAFSPNLLAHSRLATADAGCSVLMFAAVWTFWTAMRKGRNGAWAVCGVVTGLALLSKYTALLLGPIYLILIAGTWLLAREPMVPPARLRGLAIAGVVAFLVVGAGYNFTFDWGAFVGGVSKIYADHRPGYHYYLLGTTSTEPWWYYCVVAFLIKVPVPTLVLLVLALGCLLYWRRQPDVALYLLVPPTVVVAASFFDAANLGLRRILPAFPFLLLFTSHVVGTGHGTRPVWRKGWIAVIALLVALSAVEGVRSYPHYLSYFNLLAGGPERGPYLLDDSNVDWGQDLPALARWQREHPDVSPLRLAYFGTAVPEAYGITATAFSPREVRDPRPGYYAISAHVLVAYRKASAKYGREIDWLSRFDPVARAGYSIYIYHFPKSESQ